MFHTSGLNQWMHRHRSAGADSLYPSASGGSARGPGRPPVPPPAESQAEGSPGGQSPAARGEPPWGSGTGTPFSGSPSPAWPVQRGPDPPPRPGAPPQQSPAAQSIAAAIHRRKRTVTPPICSIDHPRPVDGVRGHPLHSDGAEVVVVPDAHLPALPVCIVDVMTVPHLFSVHVGICPSCSPCSGLHDPLVIQMIGVVPVIGAMSHHLGTPAEWDRERGPPIPGPRMG